MKFEQAREIAEKAIKQLSESLEQGHSEQLQNYLRAMAKFPRYSLHNILLILAQRPQASRVGGYKTWQQLGRFVKKGARGILIFAPVVRRQRADQNELERPIAATVAGFRAVYVFDEADTDGEPVPGISQYRGDPGGFTTRLKLFLASRAIELEYSDHIAPALGQCSPGRIVLLPQLSPAREFSTLAHETAHALLHVAAARRAETTKQTRETEAEAVAFVVSTAIGLEAGNSAAEYISLYSGDKNVLTESLENIQRTSAEIIVALTESA
jgi:hypothetical protein